MRICLCCPSDVEGMALSLLEAMSYGNCCVVSDIEENMEVVGRNAVPFHKSDVSDLKNRLEELLLNPRQVKAYQETSQE